MLTPNQLAKKEKTMITPITYTADQLRTHPNIVQIDGVKVYARPKGLQGLFLITRIKAAWAVFTGKADVLTWTGQ